MVSVSLFLFGLFCLVAAFKPTVFFGLHVCFSLGFGVRCVFATFCILPNQIPFLVAAYFPIYFCVVCYISS